MKTIVTICVLTIISIVCKGQCDNSATFEETTSFISKSIANYASGNAAERYKGYKMDVSRAFGNIIIEGEGTIPIVTLSGNKNYSDKVRIRFEIPITDIAGNVVIKSREGYSQLEIHTLNGSKTIKKVLSFPPLPGDDIEMGSRAYMIFRNDDNMPQRLKDALEHLFCLLGKTKDKF